ncbi:MAG: SWIM zinc finger family protein [Ktedonobacteraceae bacterium]
MGIQLSTDQVMALAPDSSSANAGKKLAGARHWQHPGQSAEALWGECQGSALYQVRVDLSSTTIQCSCPSRKFPCKHGIGLLLLAVNTPSAIPTAEHPEWVATWLAKRSAASKKREKPTTPEDAGAPQAPARTDAAQSKRAGKRLTRVSQGLDRLDLWLNDLLRSGLASVETQPASFWENQAAPLDDAQAPAIANRLRALATIPNASPDWPERLLAQVGRLALLTHAFRQGEKLDTALQEDVRQMIGWSIPEEEVATRGTVVTDDWLFLGQRVEHGTRLHTQYTWLLGIHSGRNAMLLQFAVASTPFSKVYLLGTRQHADVAFWPGAYPQRARIEVRRGEIAPITERLPGTESMDTFLASIAAALARQPWLERNLCVLQNVTPVYDIQQQRWSIRDQSGAALPLAKGKYWRLLALSGGRPIDFAGEWDGEALFPLGVLADGAYHLL